MIPLADITAWSNTSPWGNQHYIEQDLVLCRILTELFNDNLLASKLAFRGGTAIHKLYLLPQPRYSEDIDLVQLTPEPIGEVINGIREILLFLGKPTIKQTQRGNTIFYHYLSEPAPQVKSRIKIEINCQEHLNVHGVAIIPFSVRNPWFTGDCNIVSYSIDELIGTKIRALYQRKKGRDLFDVYYAMISGELDVDKTLFCYKKYMELSVGQVPSPKQYLDNLSGKINDPLFISDMRPLLRPGIRYDVYKAYELFREHFIEAM